MKTSHWKTYSIASIILFICNHTEIAAAELLNPTPHAVNSVRIAGNTKTLKDLNDGSFFKFTPTGASARLTYSQFGTIAWSCENQPNQPWRLNLGYDQYAHWVGYIHAGIESSSCGETQFENSNIYSRMYINKNDKSEVICEGSNCRGTFSAVSQDPSNYVSFKLDTNTYLYQYFYLKKNQLGEPKGCSIISTDMNNSVVSRWYRAMENTGAWEVSWDDNSGGTCTEIKTGKAWTGSWKGTSGVNSAHAGNPRYDFQVTTATNVNINLMSNSNIDTYLHVLKDGQPYATDDDAGTMLNSQLKLSLPPGRYTVVAATFANNQTGNFALTITSDDDITHAMRYEESSTLQSTYSIPTHIYPIYNEPFKTSRIRAVLSSGVIAKLRFKNGSVVANAQTLNGLNVIDTTLNSHTEYELLVSLPAPNMSVNYNMNVMVDGGRNNGGIVEMFQHTGNPSTSFAASLEDDNDTDYYRVYHKGGLVAINQGISVPATVEIRQNSSLIATLDFGQFDGASNPPYKEIGYKSAGYYDVVVRRPTYHATENGKYQFNWLIR